MNNNLFKNIISFISENFSIKSFFNFLTLVNSLCLTYSYLNDKPKLKSKPVSKYGNYINWTIFPDSKDEYGNIIRTYAFIPYMRVFNVGKRPVELDEWTLKIKDNTINKYKTLDISPIPEAYQQLKDGSTIVYKILGMNDNTEAINPGCSMSGLSLYVIQFIVNKKESKEECIVIKEDNSVDGYFIIKDMYGKEFETKLNFTYKSFEEISKVMPEIDKAIYKK